MKYLMKSGILYDEEFQQVLAKVKNTLTGPVKKIYQNAGEPSLSTDIYYADTKKEHIGDVRYKSYVLINRKNQIIATAQPEYAEEDDPDINGWPLCRMPRVNHAQVFIDDQKYLLTMHNSQNYSMKNTAGHEVLKIMHRGLSGGWSLEDTVDFAPDFLCGLFAFCRYIEQENEFLIV